MKKHSICTSPNMHCYPNLENVSAVQCFISLNVTKFFCEANERCATYGKTMNRISNLVGRNYNSVIKYFPNKSFWTRINQMNFRQLQNSTKYWIDGFSKPYLMNTLESDLHMDGSEYNGKHIAYYDHLDNTLLPTLSNRTDAIDVICEVEQNNNNNTTIRDNNKNHNHFIHIKQFQKCLNVSNEELFSPGKCFDGCYSQITMLNVQQCAYRCAEDENCLRFYYNHLKNTCILTQYIISLIPSYYQNMKQEWDCYSLHNHK
ncbi:unnamed protein product [Schistosoma turkestanicum]|nr:unnamed protein product [Schistosoma turkestanicum]